MASHNAFHLDTVTAPPWKVLSVLDSSGALVWGNANPALSLLRHWCSMWKIKSVAHSFPPPPSPHTHISVYDREQFRVYRERERESGESDRIETELKHTYSTVQFYRLCGQIQSTAHLLLALKCPMCLRQENSVSMWECEPRVTERETEKERGKHFAAFAGNLGLDICI